MSSTVSIAFGAVKYTTPSRLPEMLMTPVYSCTAGEPSIRYGEPIEAGCCAATSKKFVVPSTKVLSSCSYSMAVAMLPQQLRDRFVQLPVGEGLVEEAIRAALHRFDGRRFVRQRRDDQDADGGLHRDQPGNALDAIHVRHGDVHGHHVRIGPPEEIERLDAIGGGADQLQLLELLGALDTATHEVRVIDDHQLEGSLAVATHGAVAPACARPAAHATAVLTASAAGRTILKRVNLPGWVLTPILPPSA